MPNEEVPQEAEGNRASAELNQGLKSCHAMVTNYRAMIADALSESALLQQASSREAEEA